MVTVPAATPLTSPLALTVAMALLPEVQVTGRDTSCPVAVRGSAWSCTVPPTCTEAVPGTTVTLVTGGRITRIEALPVLPSAVAVMVAVPAATAVTLPAPSTVATAALVLVHA